MDYQEMIKELTKHRDEALKQIQELNIIIIRQEAQIQLLSYLIEQENQQEVKQDEGIL